MYVDELEEETMLGLAWCVSTIRHEAEMLLDSISQFHREIGRFPTSVEIKRMESFIWCSYSFDFNEVITGQLKPVE